MEIQDFSSTLSLVLLFLMFMLVSIMVRSSKAPKLPPGPWKLPFIGSIHHLLAADSVVPPHRNLKDLSRLHGPIMHLQLGEISAIVISSPSMAEQVMKTHDLAFANRPQVIASKILTYNHQDIVFAPYGAYWRQMRRICMMELLSVKNVRSFASIREDEVNKVVKSIRLSSSSGFPVNVTKKVSSLVNVVTARAAFGKRCEDQDVVIKLLKETDVLAGGFDLCDFFPSFKILAFFSRLKERLENAHKQFDTVFDKIINQHKENLGSTGRGNGESGEEDLVDALLRHQKSGDLECPITTDNIKAVIQDMFGGGTETSSTTIEWAISEMMRNPKVMEKAQTEVREAWKGKKIIHEGDVQGLDYLKSVIKETLRLHPPFSLYTRESREECSIGGYNIPIKTKVVINAWAIGRDPKHWEDAESFLPERFEGNSSVDFTGKHFEYIPFGAGRRMCPGMSFGNANTEFPLAQLLYHFNWKLPNGMEPEDLDMSEAFGITASRKNNLCLFASPYHLSLDS